MSSCCSDGHVIGLQAHAARIKMAAPAVSPSSRFAGVKTFSEKFSRPEVDAEGNIRKVGIP